jgi:TnpA family transposase
MCHVNIDLAKITAPWEQIVHLVASVHSGHTSAIQVLARFGAAARGDPLYEAPTPKSPGKIGGSPYRHFWHGNQGEAK